MRTVETIPIETAKELLNFKSGPDVSQAMADDQLEGAVAIHNILAKEGFAYLADEVGMGKTYVALGAVSLLRFFNPGYRVLYVAPRENIQRKWLKELRNFVTGNWRRVDQRVKSVQETPARGIAYCDSLLDWTEKAVRDPHRDFFCRLTSFSLPLSSKPSEWEQKRRALLQITPLKYRSQFGYSGKDKARFKRAYASTLNILQPHYDLIVFDEGHNLKHGRSSGAARNQLIQYVLGSAPAAETGDWDGFGKRFDRVLFLSATPLETDYVQLWNQLDLFGFGDAVPELRDQDLPDAVRHEAAGRFLVRRLTGLRIADDLHTKNMYRREWRGGGCRLHDDPLKIPNDQQKLIVALVQKKVAEVLSHEKFNNRFQIGMLASFESFLETAGVKEAERKGDAADVPDEDGEETESTFEEGAEQTREQAERDGIDTPAVNELASSYSERFGTPLPHPKMDAVVASLSQSFKTGEKALVFVRRIRSVEEIANKLSVEYDRHIFDYLNSRLREEPRESLRRLRDLYRKARSKSGLEDFAPEEGPTLPDPEADLELLQETGEAEDTGGLDTFFSWFFRGDGPPGWLSGAAFRKNRLRGEGSVYSTFFEDNYVADLLQTRSATFESLCKVLNRPAEPVNDDLRRLAASRLQQSKRQRLPRFRVFHAYQEAALELLAEADRPVSKDARTIRQKRYLAQPLHRASEVREDIPDPYEFLDTPTFFTELRHRPALAERLWPNGNNGDFAKQFADRERRRELLSTAARLGHAFIDLWILAINRLGSIELRTQEQKEDRVTTLIEDYLNLLDSQIADTDTFTALRELQLIAEQHDLIHAVNFPEALRASIPELPRLYGTSLGKQSPVGRMHGGARSDVTVRQFRLPGYPFVLISTDVLREGEDLHTFCSRVIHYGLAFTPSAMEQRTGRVDRIGSLIHRRLDDHREPAEPEELLQVFYPYLGDTVERIQAHRVFERMNRFLRLIHTGFRTEKVETSIDTKQEFADFLKDIEPIRDRLETRFPVKDHALKGTLQMDRQPFERVEELLNVFQLLRMQISKVLLIKWDQVDGPAGRYGTVFLRGKEFLPPDREDEAEEPDVRQQPFALMLRKSAHGDYTLLHGLSPVGSIDFDNNRTVRELLEFQSAAEGDKICAVPRRESDSYSLSVEGDVLLDPDLTQSEELSHLIRRICLCADLLERRFRGGQDITIDQFRRDLHKEARRASH